MTFSWLMGVLIGAPWFLAFSPTQYWWLGFAQLLILVSLIRIQSSPKNAFLLGWMFGASGLGLGVGWLYISLHQYGGLPAWFAILSLVLFSLYLGLFAGAAAWAWHVLKRAQNAVWMPWSNAFLWASLWTFFEWFRGYFLTGFAWLSLGDSIVDSPLAGLLPWFGNHGVTFLVVFLTSGLLMALLAQAKRFVLAGVIVFALGFALIVGLLQIDLESRSSGIFKMAGVQTNVDQSIKFEPDMIFDNMEKVFRMGDIGLSVIDPDAALIFPETVNPLLWSDSPLDWLRRFRDFAADRPGVSITGGAIQEKGRYYNSVVLFDGTEPVDALAAPSKRHDKRHLVPFGETIPTGFHWFVALLNMPMGEFEPGSGPLKPLLTQGNALAATVCYEDTFSGEFASLVRHATQEPTIFLNLSNLAWFGRSNALDQHAQMGRTRSAEHLKPTLRVTNTGVSGAINEYGQWVNRVPAWQDKVWSAEVTGRLGLTPFAKYGHILWFLVWMPPLALIALRILRIRAYNMAHSQK